MYAAFRAVTGRRHSRNGDELGRSGRVRDGWRRVLASGFASLRASEAAVGDLAAPGVSDTPIVLPGRHAVRLTHRSMSVSLRRLPAMCAGRPETVPMIATGTEPGRRRRPEWEQ